MAKKPDDWKRTWRRFPSFIVVLDSPRRREAACRHFISPCKQKPQPNTRYLAGAKSYALWYPLWAPIFRPNAQGELLASLARPLGPNAPRGVKDGNSEASARGPSSERYTR